jgi:hypothetical protein
MLVKSLNHCSASQEVFKAAIYNHPFDEMYGAEASRSLVYLKLYQARLRTGHDWLFCPDFPGKAGSSMAVQGGVPSTGHRWKGLHAEVDSSGR